MSYYSSRLVSFDFSLDFQSVCCLEMILERIFKTDPGLCEIRIISSTFALKMRQRCLREDFAMSSHVIAALAAVQLLVSIVVFGVCWLSVHPSSPLLSPAARP